MTTNPLARFQFPDGIRPVPPSEWIHFCFLPNAQEMFSAIKALFPTAKLQLVDGNVKGSYGGRLIYDGVPRAWQVIGTATLGQGEAAREVQIFETCGDLFDRRDVPDVWVDARQDKSGVGGPVFTWKDEGAMIQFMWSNAPWINPPGGY